MANQSLAQYTSSFKPETRELLVRISWLPKEVHPDRNLIDGQYKVQARFDRAIDPETDQIVYDGVNSTIEWLVKKRLFGNPFGYRFKVGGCYRLLVRKALNSPRNPFFYVERVLETDVYDERLDPIRSFLNDYDHTEQEVLFLNRRESKHWGSFYGRARACMTALAWIDPQTDTLTASPAYVNILSNGSHAPYHFDALTAYRIKARRHLHYENTWLITSVLGSADDPRLTQIKEAYRKPVTLEDSLGTFQLNHEMDWYEGRIQWLDSDTLVYLCVEPGGTDASIPLATLHRIAQDIPSFDQICRTYISDNLYDLLQDWYDGDITKEEFAREIGIPVVSIGSDGSGSLSYESGELFADHQITLEFDADLKPGETNLAG